METDPDAQSYFDSNSPLLNEHQQIVYNTIKEAIDSNHGGFDFLDAPVGTGKLFF